MTDTIKCSKCKKGELDLWVGDKPYCQKCFDREYCQPTEKPNAKT